MSENVGSPSWKRIERSALRPPRKLPDFSTAPVSSRPWNSPRGARETWVRFPRGIRPRGAVSLLCRRKWLPSVGANRDRSSRWLRVRVGFFAAPDAFPVEPCRLRREVRILRLASPPVVSNAPQYATQSEDLHKLSICGGPPEALTHRKLARVPTPLATSLGVGMTKRLGISRATLKQAGEREPCAGSAMPQRNNGRNVVRPADRARQNVQVCAAAVTPTPRYRLSAYASWLRCSRRA